MSASRAIMTPSRTDFEANLASPRSLKEDVEQFLYRQSEFLDNRDWDAWLDLFAPTGIYWIAAHPDDPSPDGRPCICCEDRYLMRTRIKRLRNPKAWSQLPPHRTAPAMSCQTSRLSKRAAKVEVLSFNRGFTWWNCDRISSAI